MANKLRITQIKSLIGQQEGQIQTVKALGLKRIRDVAELSDTPQIRGMLRKVSHLVAFEEI